MAPAFDPRLSFFFIRHGETDWNRDGRLQGQRDVPINALGRDQAAAAGRTLQDLLRKRRDSPHPSSLRYVASPLRRARDTMERARRAMRLSPHDYAVDERLKELSFGAWEGFTWPEVKGFDSPAVKERKRDKWSFVPPQGESYAMLAERLRPWLTSVRHLDVVVAHGGVARVLFHLIGGCPPERAPDLDIWQGRVLTFESGRFHWS